MRAFEHGVYAIREIAGVSASLLISPIVDAVRDLGVEERAEMEIVRHIAPVSRLPTIPTAQHGQQLPNAVDKC